MWYMDSKSQTLAGLGRAISAIVLCTFILITSQSSLANSSTTAVDEAALERRVWEAKTSELGSLEIEIARIIQRAPESTFGHYLLSHIYMRLFSETPSELNLLKTASDLAQQAIELGPQNEIGYVALANVLDAMGHPVKGVELLTNSVQQKAITPSWRLPFTLARLKSEVEPADRILDLLLTSMKTAGTQREIIIPYVIAAAQASTSEDKQLDRFAALDQEYPDKMFKLVQADMLSEKGAYDKAHVLYQRVLKDNPLFSAAAINDAKIQYEWLNQASAAEQTLLRIVNSPAIKSEGNYEIVMLHLGVMALQKSDRKLAFDYFSKALASNGLQSQSLDAVISAFRRRKQHEALAEFLYQVLRDIRGSGVAYGVLGEVLSENLGRHHEAIRAFENALTLEPERTDIYNGMGLVYFRQKDFENALKVFQAAIKIDSSDPLVRYNEACALVKLGRLKDGMNSLASAIGLDPNLKETAEKDTDLAAIRSLNEFKEIVSYPAGTLDDLDALPTTTEEDLFGH
jgi:tetratricopeptide (TPR) repeat protein